MKLFSKIRSTFDVFDLITNRFPSLKPCQCTYETILREIVEGNTCRDRAVLGLVLGSPCLGIIDLFPNAFERTAGERKIQIVSTGRLPSRSYICTTGLWPINRTSSASKANTCSAARVNDTSHGHPGPDHCKPLMSYLHLCIS
jgi:hypothetical protein